MWLQETSKAEAGYIATGALITSAIGGWLAGILADKYGRVRILQLTVLWFTVFTFLSGFTTSPGQLLVTRALQGQGFGGEWPVGSVLMRTTLFASLLATGMQSAYYAVTTWLPTFLKTDRHLSVLNTSGYLLVLIVGSFAGYLTSAWLSDRLGRRQCFIPFAVSAGALVCRA